MGLLTTLPLVLVVGALVVALVLALAACWLLYQRYARLKRERAREAARARLQGELAAAWAACQASLTGFDTLTANIRRKSSEAAKRNLSSISLSSVSQFVVYKADAPKDPAPAACLSGTAGVAGNKT